MMGGHTFGGRYAPQALSLLRIVAALIFLMHGTAKLFGFPETEMPMPEAGSLMWAGGLLEFVGAHLREGGTLEPGHPLEVCRGQCLPFINA